MIRSFTIPRIVALVLMAMIGLALLALGSWTIRVYGRAIGLSVIGISLLLLFTSLVMTLISLRRFAHHGSMADESRLCRGCGYDTAGLPMARCPECGALTGFTRSLDDLGISEDEIRRE